MLTKWWKSELILAINFGSLCPKVTNFGSQNFGYQIWFCTRLLISLTSHPWGDLIHRLPMDFRYSITHEICIWLVWLWFVWLWLSLQFMVVHVINLLIFFRVTSLALGQSYDCPSAREATLKDIGQINKHQITTKHKVWIVCIIFMIYCICQ